MITQPYFQESPLRSMLGYYALSIPDVSTHTIPMYGTIKTASFAQFNSNQIQVLKNGRYFLSLLFDFQAVGNLNKNPGASVRIELIKNSTVLAVYQAVYNYGSTNTTYTRSGWQTTNYWMDDSNHAATPSGNIAGSALSIDCRMVYEADMDLLSSDFLFLRATTFTNSPSTAISLSFRNMATVLTKVT